MDRFTHADLQSLVQARQTPCVSVYLATHLTALDTDRTRLRELLSDAGDKLRQQGMAWKDTVRVLAPARRLLRNMEFWHDVGRSLAVFVAGAFLRTYRLPVAFPDRVIVGSRFYVKPMLSFVAGDGRYYILALSQNQVRLLEAAEYSVREITVPDFAAGIADARQTHDRDEPLNYHTHAAAGGRGMEAVYHGQGVGKDDHKDELLHYFRQIDQALLAALGTDAAPLVLAAVDYLVPLYRKASKHPHILDRHVKGSPDRVSAEDLHVLSRPIVVPLFRETADRAVAQYRQLAGTGRTTAELAAILLAAHRGELQTLFVVDERDVWGHFDPVAGWVEEHMEVRRGSEELTNLAVSYALERGRDVHVVEPGDVFPGVALAGTYFVPMAKHGAGRTHEVLARS